MGRVSGWESKLYACIEEAKLKPFEWGSHDCVAWTLSVVQELTGVDYYEPYRGRYSSELGAAKVIKQAAPSLEDIVSMSFDEIPVLMAGRGDIVMHQKALGVCDGYHSHFVTEQGLTTVKTAACTNAWRVS